MLATIPTVHCEPSILSVVPVPRSSKGRLVYYVGLGELAVEVSFPDALYGEVRQIVYAFAGHELPPPKDSPPPRSLCALTTQATSCIADGRAILRGVPALDFATTTGGRQTSIPPVAPLHRGIKAQICPHRNVL